MIFSKRVGNLGPTDHRKSPKWSDSGPELSLGGMARTKLTGISIRTQWKGSRVNFTRFRVSFSGSWGRGPAAGGEALQI